MNGRIILFSIRRFCTFLFNGNDLKNPEFWGGNERLEINPLNAHKKYELIIGE